MLLLRELSRLQSAVGYLHAACNALPLQGTRDVTSPRAPATWLGHSSPRARGAARARQRQVQYTGHDDTHRHKASRRGQGLATAAQARLGQVQRAGHDDAHGHVAALASRSQSRVIPPHLHMDLDLRSPAHASSLCLGWYWDKHARRLKILQCCTLLHTRYRILVEKQ